MVPPSSLCWELVKRREKGEDERERELITVPCEESMCCTV
jgi:hypothetical protein